MAFNLYCNGTQSVDDYTKTEEQTNITELMIYVPAENQTSVSTILKIIGIAFVICGCLAGIIGFVVSKNM